MGKLIHISDAPQSPLRQVIKESGVEGIQVLKVC
jgi:hypothetical protein